MNDDITPLGVAATLVVGLFGALLWDTIKRFSPVVQHGWRQAAIQRAEDGIATIEGLRNHPGLVSILILQNLAWMLAGLAFLVVGIGAASVMPAASELQAMLPQVMRPAVRAIIALPLLFCSYGVGRVSASAHTISGHVNTIIRADEMISRYQGRLVRLRK